MDLMGGLLVDRVREATPAGLRSLGSPEEVWTGDARIGLRVFAHNPGTGSIALRCCGRVQRPDRRGGRGPVPVRATSIRRERHA